MFSFRERRATGPTRFLTQHAARRSQCGRGMAAVLCLVLLPLMASLGFMFGVVRGDMSSNAVFGGLVFLALGAIMFFGAFKMAVGWDDENGS